AAPGGGSDQIAQRPDRPVVRMGQDGAASRRSPTPGETPEAPAVEGDNHEPSARDADGFLESYCRPLEELERRHKERHLHRAVTERQRVTVSEYYGSRGCRRCSSASISGERSRPTTRCRRRPSQAAKCPVPQPTSSTVSAPGPCPTSHSSSPRSAWSARCPRRVSYHAS